MAVFLLAGKREREQARDRDSSDETTSSGGGSDDTGSESEGGYDSGADIDGMCMTAMHMHAWNTYVHKHATIQTS